MLAATAMLATGVGVMPAAAMAEETPSGPQTVDYSPTGVQRLDEAVAKADTYRKIQEDSKQTAYTADSYRTFDDAYRAATAADAKDSDEKADTLARALEKATEGLTVASWSIDGNLLELHDGTLTTAKPLAFDHSPEDVKAKGSDGSEVVLQLTGAKTTHPKLGVTAGEGTLSRQADGTRPPISIQATWTLGEEATVDGNAFTLQDGTWTASLNVTLDGENTPSTSQVKVGGSTTPIEWGALEEKDGTILTTGTATGSLDGQPWIVHATASRTIDRTGLDQAIGLAKAKRDDTSSDWTHASVDALDKALDAAEGLPQTATMSQLTAAANQVTDAAAKLVQVEWTVSVNGVKHTLEHHSGKAYTLDLKGLDTQPDEKLTASSNDPTLGDLTLIREGDTRHDTGTAFGVDTVSGDYTYHGATQDRTLDVTASFTRTDGTEILLPGGVHATPDDQDVWHATVTTTLDENGTPAFDRLDLNGQQEKIDWGKATGANKGELKRTAVVEGTLKTTGQEFRFTLTASTKVDKDQLKTLINTQAKALEPGSYHWTTKTADALKASITAAQVTFDDDASTPAQVRKAYADLQKLTLDPVTWTSGKTAFAWHADDDSYTAVDQTTLDKAPASTRTATSNDPKLKDTTLKLDAKNGNMVATDVTLGVVHLQGTAVYTGETANGNRPISLQQAYSYDAGTKTDVKVDGSTLEWTTDGELGLTAHATTTLGKDGKPTLDAIKVAGHDVKIEWADKTKSTATDTTTTYTLTGRASGELKVAGVTQKWSVDLTASRTEGKVAALTVIGRDAAGKTTSIDVDGFDPAKGDYTITLPADRATQAYTLGYRSAAGDDQPATQGDPIPTTLGRDGARILKTTLNGVTYTVTVTFEKAKPVPDNTAARLTGIYVNLDGKTEKGSLIDGWDPDVLTYTITRPKDSKGVYILPEAPKGVSVKAGDVKYTDWSSEQSWLVTAANGEHRTYTVRVVREHEPTAAEKFTPNPPKALDGTTPAPDAATTALKAIGYTDANGSFKPVKDASYTIPEGGAFAYETYAGQTVSVSEEKLSGMTWRYTLNTLAADGVSFAAHTVTVTYLTEATHKAQLDMILVDNKPIDGFDPAKTTYTVKVDNPEHWVASARFDKTSGMAVSVHKDGAKAVLTATSADGLASRAYTVNVVQRPSAKGAKGTDGTTLDEGRLASTGVNAVNPILAVIGLLTAGVTMLGASLRRNRR